MSYTKDEAIQALTQELRTVMKELYKTIAGEWPIDMAENDPTLEHAQALLDALDILERTN